MLILISVVGAYALTALVLRLPMYYTTYFSDCIIVINKYYLLETRLYFISF